MNTTLSTIFAFGGGLFLATVQAAVTAAGIANYTVTAITQTSAYSLTLTANRHLTSAEKSSLASALLTSAFMLTDA